MARPKASVDAKQVLKLASQGCKVVEIADFLGVSHDTITRRFATELTKGRANLRETLRRQQLKSANRGNVGMLIWLGKQYLGQSDETIDDYIEQAIAEAGLTKDDLLELIKNKEAAAAAEGKRSFEDFVKRAGYPAAYPKQVEMMEFGMLENVPRLLLGARGYGKTDYAVVLGVAYDIYLRPAESTTLIITKSKERNAAMLREIQDACMRNGVVFERANATHLRARGLHGKDHSVSAVTIRTVTLRGRHPKRVIMDDPVTEDDTAEAARLLAKKKYNEVMKLASNVFIIGQPAHQYDLYAELRGIVKTLEVPHGTIPELDADLEAQRAAGVDEASISASYHLKILSEGKLPFNNVKYLERFPTGDSAIAFIDPSEGGDFVALSIIKAHMQGVAVVGYVWKRAWNHCLEEMTEKLQRFKVRKLAFETNHTGNQPVEMLRELWPGIGVVGKHSSLNKHSKIMSAGAYAHLIHLSKESDRLYLDHVVKYEYKAKFDDAPDSLASGLEWIGLIRGKQ